MENIQITYSDCKEKFIKNNFKKQVDNNMLLDENGQINDNAVKAALSKAYNDMSLRTIPGIGKIEDLKEKLCKKLSGKIKEYFGEPAPNTEKEFNAIHSKMCGDFLSCFNQKLAGAGLPEQEYGKAQKIVNMTFKYLYCFGDSDKKEDWFKYCHMPLDGYILNWCLYQANISDIKGIAWSKLDEEMYKKICDDIYSYLIENGNPLYKNIYDFVEATTILQFEFIIWTEEKRKALMKDLVSALKKSKNDDYFKAFLSDDEKIIFENVYNSFKDK